MLEIRIHGRGGQGAQVACQILADAFVRAGSWVQAFAAYGGERRGAPVTAFLRVDDEPIRLRCDIERPDYLLVLDPTLLTDADLESLPEHGLAVLNSPTLPCARMPRAERMVAVDAAAIAARAGLGPIVSTAALGAFAAATGLLALDDLAAAVEARSPARAQENATACRLGYLEVSRRAGAEVSSAP